MKKLLFLLALLYSASQLRAQADISSSISPLWDDLDASLSKVEMMLKSIEPDLKQLRADLTRVSALLIEARKISIEQLELYETLLRRYESVVESFLILNELYKGARKTMLIEGGIIAALGVALTVCIIIK